MLSALQKVPPESFSFFLGSPRRVPPHGFKTLRVATAVAKILRQNGKKKSRKGAFEGVNEAAAWCWCEQCEM